MNNRYLPTALRRALEKTAKDARIVAEDGARDAIRRLGVADSKAPTYLSDEEKDLRRRLRAHARALGDSFDKTDETQETKRLVEAAAYAHWHRMLFARFLAERGLLRNPEYDVPVSLEDCRELAEAEGLTDPWAIAERYAASMLPAVFRIDDPVLALDLDPVHTQKLHRLVTGLDAEVFQAEDSLGWTYQFWRAAEKQAVNDSGVKIGADELPAVTQLFTEPYMVRFLLHNTLGAWWAGKVLAANPVLAQTAVDEDALRAACSLPDYNFDMLRFMRGGGNGPWRPAAGTFPGWPKEAMAITMLDPCCGSGHFLTEALAILVALRQAEEHLSSADSVAAVLRNNLHGLEIDGRCVQIAAFAVALSAWRIGGWQTLPVPHIAWVGAPPPLPKWEFVALADGDAELEYALAALHDLFAQAPLLGTLIEPSGGDLFEAEKMREVERLLTPITEKTRKTEPEIIEGAVSARGMSDAVSLLKKRYIIQATNVPFLGSSSLGAALATYFERHYERSRLNLATVLLERLRRLSHVGGSVAGVFPSGWTFQSSATRLRNFIASQDDISFVVPLGDGAFESSSAGEAVGLCCLEVGFRTEKPVAYISAEQDRGVQEKSRRIQNSDIEQIDVQSLGPNTLLRPIAKTEDPRLETVASAYQGLKTGDLPRFVQYFWEPSYNRSVWEPIRDSVSDVSYSGCQKVILWESGNGRLADYARESRDTLHDMHESGQRAWGKEGVLLNAMGDLRGDIYYGEKFLSNTSVMIPKNHSIIGALFSYCSDAIFSERVRAINPSRKVTNGSLVQVPFSRQGWTSEFERRHSGTLPEPYTDDPSQWLFHGHPASSGFGTAIHSAMARLCGYRWPAETDAHMRLSEKARALAGEAAKLPPGDNDGLIGVPPVAGEKSLADRLRAYLASVFGSDPSDSMERRLIAEADELLDKKVARDGSLETWVRDRAFSQHCTLFDQRPFLWHISDGLKDGFSVFVHYHRFDQANLRKLTYTLLGDWLARAKAENNALRYEKGRELQQTLEKVLEGEKPYDIFVRWKSLAQQPLGWDPDLDDGVRQNIRPFIKAGVLTHDLSKILKDKDRGNDVASAPWYPVFNGERRNDHHTTLAEKRAAREAAARRAEAAK